MEDLTVKDVLSKVLLMHTSFGTPSVGYHDDLIRPLGLIFFDIHHGYENVGKMGDTHYVDGFDVSVHLFWVFGYFFPESNSLSFLFC